MKETPPVPRVGATEMLITTAVIMSSKVFLSFPRLLIERNAQAAWLTALLALGPAAVGYLLLTRVMADYPGQTLNTVIGRVMPSLLRFPLQFTMFILFLSSAATNLRQYAEGALITTLPESSVNHLLLVLLAVTALGLYQGLEPMTRVTTIFVIPLALGLSGIYGLAFFAGDLRNLTPVLGAGPGAVLRDSLLYSSAYVGMYYILYFAPGLPDNRQMRNVGLGALAIAGLVIAGGAAVAVVVFGFPVAAEFTVPIFTVARTISIGRFFQRVEAFFTFTWMVSGSITIVVASSLALQILGELLRVKDPKPLIPPILALIYALALMPNDYQSAIKLDEVARNLGPIYILGIPAAIWAAGLWRKRGHRE